MGMFDSLFVKCPNCEKEIEFQSKSGVCMLDVYHKNNLPPEVARGMDEDIIKCIGCGKNIQLLTHLPVFVKIKLKVVKEKASY